MTELPHVRLRALVAADADVLEAGYGQAADPYNWAGHRDAGWVTAALNEQRTLHFDRGTLAVVDDAGLLAGDVSFHKLRTGPSEYSWCWAIGVTLLPDHRGKGLGSAAQRELARYLFSTTPAERVEADTDIDNVAEQRSLERAGFRREGVRRASQWRHGAWHDTTVYAVVRGDFSVGEL